ncbi:MAG: C10 family peptidase [Clostridium sp.]|nr:C10 family peptidase [Prevotella sp.]MCM1378119.1 C10 family peptidase [Prevotella sp.]MCM1428947.1 C10 family peptidase [Clostridium sp.]
MNNYISKTWLSLRSVAVALAVFLSLGVCDSLAAPVSPDEAMQDAQSALKRNTSWIRRAPAADASLTLAYTSVTPLGNAFYVFNSSDGGFAIISADDRLPAVLAVSKNGNFDYDRIPDTMKWWLGVYDSQIKKFLEEDPQIPASQTRAMRRAVALERQPVSPLVKTMWDQTEPFNNFCPRDPRTSKLSVTGCVATAMAQVMKYHEWPVHPKGATSDYTFDGTTLDWANMLDEYLPGKYTYAQADAVALLMRQCGAGVDMQYSSYMSGAYSYDVPEALIEYFDYNPSMQLLFREFYSQVQWNNIVYDEVAAGRPVYYSGQSPEGGHAFVCDGYLSNDLFHFNWGWGGYQDGYFRLNALNPSAGGTGSYNGGYNSSQSIITGVKKAAGEIQRQQLIVSTGEFVYDSAKKTFKVANGEGGYNLMYNPLGHEEEFNAGIKIIDAADPTNVKYVKSNLKTILQPLYGFQEMSFSMPSLSNGTYHIHPAMYNCYGEWSDILVPYGKQSYVTLTVAGSKQTFSNDGPDPSTFSEIIPSKLSSVSTVYEGDALAFQMTLTNVKPGDFYNYVGLGVYPQDPNSFSVGDVSATVTVPGLSSIVTEFSLPDGLDAGLYDVYLFDKSFTSYMTPTTLEVKKRDKAQPAVESELIVSSVAPNFIKSTDPCGVTLSVENVSSKELSSNFVVKLYSAENLKEVYSLTSNGSCAIEAGQRAVLNFEPRNLDLAPGNYYWRVQNGEGKLLSVLNPLVITGKPFTVGVLEYEVTNEIQKTVRVCGLKNEDVTSVIIPETVNGYKVTQIAPGLFAFAGKLKSITLPSGISYLPAALFYNALSLKYLTMNAQNPAGLGYKVFTEERIPEIVVSGPGSYTNLYALSEQWAPFAFSAWNMIFEDGIDPAGLLRDDAGNIYSPYYVPATSWLSFDIKTPEGKFVKATWEYGSEKGGSICDGFTSLPPLFGLQGTVTFSISDVSGVGSIDVEAVPVDVYTPQGVIVLRAAMPEDISRLPKGIYIAAGKKVFVR